MKKKISLSSMLFVLLAFLLAVSGIAAAEEGEVQVIAEESIREIIEGKSQEKTGETEQTLSLPTLVMEDGVTLLPMREYFELLGAKVSWQEKINSAIAVREDLEVIIPVGGKQSLVNGTLVDTGFPARIIDGSTYINLGTAGKLTGYHVTWDESEEVIKISEAGKNIEFPGEDADNHNHNHNQEAIVETVSQKVEKENDESRESEMPEEALEETAARELEEPEEPQVVYTERGTASWYGPGFQGNMTSSGETFNKNELTAAHPSLPFNTYVEVTFLQTGQSTTVRINDRGPHVGGRIIDLSRAAAEAIGLRPHGLGEVKLRVFDK